MAIDDTRLGIKWWKRRCRYGSCETGSNWHKPATGRADNDVLSKRERQPRRQINSERCTIHAPLRSRFSSTFTHQFFSLKLFNFSRHSGILNSQFVHRFLLFFIFVIITSEQKTLLVNQK